MASLWRARKRLDAFTPSPRRTPSRCSKAVGHRGVAAATAPAAATVLAGGKLGQVWLPCHQPAHVRVAADDAGSAAGRVEQDGVVALATTRTARRRRSAGIGVQAQTPAVSPMRAPLRIDLSAVTRASARSSSRRAVLPPAERRRPGREARRRRRPVRQWGARALGVVADCTETSPATNGKVLHPRAAGANHGAAPSVVGPDAGARRRWPAAGCITQIHRRRVLEPPPGWYRQCWGDSGCSRSTRTSAVVPACHRIDAARSAVNKPARAESAAQALMNAAMAEGAIGRHWLDGLIEQGEGFILAPHQPAVPAPDGAQQGIDRPAAGGAQTAQKCPRQPSQRSAWNQCLRAGAQGIDARQFGRQRTARLRQHQPRRPATGATAAGFASDAAISRPPPGGDCAGGRKPNRRHQRCREPGGSPGCRPARHR